jgi:hypothetical protein
VNRLLFVPVALIGLAACGDDYSPSTPEPTVVPASEFTGGDWRTEVDPVTGWTFRCLHTSRGNSLASHTMWCYRAAELDS